MLKTNMEIRIGVLLLLVIGFQVAAGLRRTPVYPRRRPPVEPPILPDEASYLAIVPQYVRPNSILSIPVTFLQPVGHETVTAILLEDENKTLAQDSVISNGQSEVTLNLRVPGSISWGTYRVNITGKGSINFENSTHVWGKHKSISIFVQTDKAMYKPGDKVKYRIFATNGALDPVAVTMDVNFYDPKGNKIDELNGVSTADGIRSVEGELALSDMPPLGNWRIEVIPQEFESGRTNYYFSVEEYVLPKFEVTVTLPSFGREDQEFLTGTVNARYTFGKPVQGYLILTITRPWGRGFYDPRAIRTEMLIDGEKSFDIPRVVLERLTRNFESKTLMVHANVTESITGITQDGSSNIQYYSNPYKISFHPRLPDNFKPGFNLYNVLVKVTTQDDRPPVGVTEPLKVSVTYFTDKPKTGTIPHTIEILEYEAVSPFLEGETIMIEENTYPITEDGTVAFDLTIPAAAATGTIKAEFKGQRVYKEISRFRSPSEVYLKAEASGMDPIKVGELVTFKLSSSEKPAEGTYLVVARNKIVKSGKFEIRGATSEASISFTVTRDMAPAARFVAYFVRADDEIVADGLNFAVEDIYQNKVTIQFDQTNNVAPKTNVNLRVTADKDSVVNVLVYDRSVRLLKDGNDITRDRVDNELSQYGDTPYIDRSWGIIRPWPVTADDASDIFSNAQLKVLTDANLHQFNLWELDQPEFGNGAFGGGGPMFKASPMMDTAAARAVGGANVGEPTGGGGRMIYPSVSYVRTGGYRLPENFAAGPKINLGTIAGGVGQIRKEFPEAWIWTSLVANANGFVDISAKVPDTITTWEANAYALNIETGLGVAPVTSNLTAFLPFFVAMQMPYSIIRGEIAVIQANVFNYHPEDLQVLVTLRGSGNFVGIETDSSGQETEITGDLTRCVLAKSGKPTPVFFSIKPTAVGTLSVNVRIDEQKQKNIFDEIFRDLLVKAEGEKKDKNHPILVSHQINTDVTTTSTAISYPNTTVPDSEKIRVTVFGDLFGPSLENLDTLIKMPYGCGEQNMLHFAPAVFAAVYMKATDRFQNDADLQRKLSDVLRTGYQRELVYQRHDGSFSAFGNADDEGSLWLTAFVIKSFAQAFRLNLIFIDENVIDKAVRFITRVEHQTPDGNFVNTGIVSHKAMQGGSASSERSLTAYVLIALKEVADSRILKNPETLESLTKAMENATSYLDERIFLPITDYEGAIVSYALELVKSPMYAAFLGRLEESANKTVKDGSKYWKNPSYAMEIEIASYALLTYSLKNDKENGMMILKWLVKQRNAYGGFSSTQDTVVGLQALTEFAKLIYSKEVSMTIDISTKKGEVSSAVQSVQLNRDNHDVLHYKDFDGDVDSVEVEARGAGLALIDINVFYNVMSEPEPPSYELKVTPYDESENRFMLKACTRFLKQTSKSNMAIMSVGAPSGFEPLKDGLEGNSLVKRLEVAGGRLNIYFDDIPTTEVCLDIKVQRETIVLGVKPANVIVYSYYEPNERALVSYLPDILKQSSSVCSLCQTSSEQILSMA